MGWGEAHDLGTGTSAQIEEAHRLLDEYGTPKGPLGVRIAAVLKDIESRIIPVVLAFDGSFAPEEVKQESSDMRKVCENEVFKEEYTERMVKLLEGELTTCTVGTLQRWTCTICDRKVHGGGESCTCSAYREKDFNFSTLCVQCYEIYDKLIGDKSLQLLLKHMFRKYYFEGTGSIIDF